MDDFDAMYCELMLGDNPAATACVTETTAIIDLTASTTELEVAMKEMTQKVLEISGPAPVISSARTTEPSFYDEREINLLDAYPREVFRNEEVFEETHLFTRPLLTTTTVEGLISNVSIMESDIIHRLEPDEKVVVLRCNYGRKQHASYVEPVKEKRTNRGRKKKTKKQNTRKKQGNGSDFNSQITFVTRLYEGADDILKIKVFRTGKIQLPGVHQHTIDEVIVCAEYITEMLNAQLHVGHPKDFHSQLMRITPVMKNYKFVLKMPPGYILDLWQLLLVLRDIHAAQIDGIAAGPKILMLRHVRNETKLSIKISTPTLKKKSRSTRVNIFLSGKINLLGTIDTEVTRDICEFLHGVIEDNYDELVVVEGTADEDPIVVDNIEPMTDEEVQRLKEERRSIPGFNMSPEVFCYIAEVARAHHLECMEAVCRSLSEIINVNDR